MLPLVSLAQYKVRTLQHKEDKNLTFPIFSGTNKTAVKKINDHLQFNFFDTTSGGIPESKLFDETRFVSDDIKAQTGYTSISYKVELNNSRILSVVFEVEGMGAYPTFYKRYFSFNSGSGEPLTPDSVFTKQGMEEIKKMLIEKRGRDIVDWIESLKEASQSVFQEDSSFIVERLAACNALAHESNMYAGKEGILFYKDDCFSHAWQPYETNLDIKFTCKELDEYLSAFGKGILFTR